MASYTAAAAGATAAPNHTNAFPILNYNYFWIDENPVGSTVPDIQHRVGWSRSA
jgi:hypothetical protein